jgi:hypothetical protein
VRLAKSGDTGSGGSAARREEWEAEVFDENIKNGTLRKSKATHVSTRDKCEFGVRHRSSSGRNYTLPVLWEYIQFRPFAVDVFRAFGDGATAILQQLARKRSEHTSMTVGACKRLAFQSLSVALQTANARMLRSRKAIVAPLSLPQLPGAAS